MTNGYIVVKSIKSGIKLSASGKLYLEDIMFVVLMIGISFTLQPYVYEKLFIPFVIFNGIVGLLLVRPSTYNPGKKYWQSLYLYMVSITDLYYPLKNTSQQKKIDKMLKELE